MIYQIKLNTLKDVANLNDIALGYNGKLLVNCGSISIDAKSLLALATLIGRSNINLVAPDHENPSKFIKIIRQISTSIV